MKNIIKLIGFIALVAVIGFTMAGCSDPTDQGLKYTLSSDGTGYYVSKGTVTSGAVVIPATYNGKPVKQIGVAYESGSGAFEGTNITGITIPDSVTYIGTRAFKNCTGITSITIPNSVTYISDNAFDSCTGLTSVTFEGTIQNISSLSPFPGDLRTKYFAVGTGGAGTYTRSGSSPNYIWKKQ